MQAGIAWGRQYLELEIPEKNLLQPRRARAAPLADPVKVMRKALEHPHNYPALWRALTPADHVAILVDERLPQFLPLLVALLEHVQQAGIQPDAITLLCLPPSTGQPWLDDLPDDFQDVRVEIHQPGDRKKLAYLATTKQGRRIYLNRTAVDADQLVLLTRRSYDPLTGYGGAELALYPGLCDEATLNEVRAKMEAKPPSSTPRPIQEEAIEVTWLLGAPFFVQVIEGAGDSIEHIVAGPLASSTEGTRLLNERWRITVDAPAAVVVASISGDPARVSIDDLARAFFTAARVVEPNGSILLLTEAAPPLTSSFERLRQQEDPGLALTLLQQEKPADYASAFMWASAATQAKLYLLSGLPEEVAEELFAIPLQKPHQAQHLLTAAKTCLFLPDAHKTLAVVS